jgi:hypothetical protein
MIMKCALLLLVCLSLALSACHSTQPKPATRRDPDLAPRSPAALASTTPTLPEDPLAGQRSTQQWREHLAHEEEERQMIFDRTRVNEHRAVVKLLQAARTRYDGAKDANAVQRVRADMPQRLSEIERRIHELDPWGNSSRLLPAYSALQQALGATYAEAKLAAIRGEKQPLEKLRASFDSHMEKIDEWLDEVAEYEDEH